MQSFVCPPTQIHVSGHTALCVRLHRSMCPDTQACLGKWDMATRACVSIFSRVGIFQSLKFRIAIKKEIFPISLKLNFTQNTSGCYGLRH